MRCLIVCRMASALFIGLLVSRMCVGGSVATTAKGNDQPAQQFRDCRDCPEMVIIPTGKFLMGTSPEETARDSANVPDSEKELSKTYFAREHPQHPVNISRPFGMGKYPVTRAEFAAFVLETRYRITGDCMVWQNHRFRSGTGATWRTPGFDQTDRDPVVCVNWQDANAYVAWLNRRLRSKISTNRQARYRLPSEAEWEFAARAGTQTARWWGDTIGRGNANCGGCGSEWDRTRTAPVDVFRANSFGLHGMLGNVWQWTEDCWHPSYSGAPLDGSAWISDGDCVGRMVRGGAWINDAWLVRSATRTVPGADYRNNFQGFRVAKSL